MSRLAVSCLLWQPLSAIPLSRMTSGSGSTVPERPALNKQDQQLHGEKYSSFISKTFEHSIRMITLKI